MNMFNEKFIQQSTEAQAIYFMTRLCPGLCPCEMKSLIKNFVKFCEIH